ncbi:MAG TPA: fibronectin type III domain-containing protein [Verrucomicrobiae bacterium]
MSTTSILRWKDDGSTMTWDHFSWDEVVFRTNMKNLKIGLKERDPVILQLVGSIIAGATGNAALDNPPITLAELGTLKTTATTAFTEEIQAKEAWQAKRTARFNAMAELRPAVKQYATFAHAVFAGDKVQLQGLGLDVVEFTGLLGVLPAPTNVRSQPGLLDSTIIVRFNAVRGRSIYKLECAESADGPWTHGHEGNRTTATCSGLVSGKEYYFRVRAIGTAGPGAWSDITKTRAK